MTKLSSIGEFGFIRKICRKFSNHIPPGITGIGDDCAVIPIDKKHSLLVTTDLLIEDRHFLLNRITAAELGWKSLAVNLSDIAAMGGTPENAFLSLSIPNTISLEWLDNFMEGISNCCKKYNVYLIGGDTTQSPDKLVINFTVLGTCKSKHIKLRSSAKPGEFVCVTGNIGDSGAGLKILLENKKCDTLSRILVKRHHMPIPHLAEGAWLAQQKAVGAMMDISDGIDSDIRRIMESSHVGAEIYLEKIPLSPELQKITGKYSWNASEIALTGGEDYCLLLTVDNKKYTEVSEKFRQLFNKPLTIIGKITSVSNKLTYFKNGKKVFLQQKGFDHFIS